MAFALFRSALLGHGPRPMSSSFSVSHKPQVLTTAFTGQFYFSVHPIYKSSDNTRDFSTKSLATNEPVVSTNWLHDNKKNPDVKILDASWYMSDKHRNPAQEYQAAHIPGAVYFDVYGISDKNTYLTHMLPSEKAFSAAVSALGIQNKDGVVIYDGSGIYSAARVWWMFKVFGHERVWVLDGGLPKWRKSRFDVESSACDNLILKSGAAIEAVEKIYNRQSIAPISFETKFQPHLVWTLEQVKKNMKEKTHQHIDARSKARFDDIAPEPWKGIRSGHIPGSKCIPYDQMLSASQTLLPVNELKKRFYQEGISLDNNVVTSCNTGVTACIVALGLYRLGKTDISVYDGSWKEYEAQFVDAPVERNN